MILGCCGAGKSTFAGRLAATTSLPVIHLDQEYWLPDWTEPDKKSWHQKVERLASRDQWIMDGNYGSSYEIRLRRADAVIYLDYPTWRCLWRVSKRVMKYHGQVRPDMPEGCKERWDWDFMHYVATYNIVRKKRSMELIKKYENQIDLVILNSDREVDNFLDNLKVISI